MSRTGGRNVRRKSGRVSGSRPLGSDIRAVSAGWRRQTPKRKHFDPENRRAFFSLFAARGRTPRAEKGSRELPKNQSAFSNRVKRRRHDGEIEKNQIAIVARDRDEEEGEGKEQRARQQPGHRLVGRGRAAQQHDQQQDRQKPPGDVGEQGRSKEQPGIVFQRPILCAGCAPKGPAAAAAAAVRSTPEVAKWQTSLSGVVTTAAKSAQRTREVKHGMVQHQRFPGRGDGAVRRIAARLLKGRDRRRRDRCAAACKAGRRARAAAGPGRAAAARTDRVRGRRRRPGHSSGPGGFPRRRPSPPSLRDARTRLKPSTRTRPTARKARPGRQPSRRGQRQGDRRHRQKHHTVLPHAPPPEPATAAPAISPGRMRPARMPGQRREAGDGGIGEQHVLPDVALIEQPLRRQHDQQRHAPRSASRAASAPAGPAARPAKAGSGTAGTERCRAPGVEHAQQPGHQRRMPAVVVAAAAVGELRHRIVGKLARRVQRQHHGKAGDQDRRAAAGTVSAAAGQLSRGRTAASWWP